MLPIYICEDDAMILAAQKKFLEKQIYMFWQLPAYVFIKHDL